MGYTKEEMILHAIHQRVECIETHVPCGYVPIKQDSPVFDKVHGLSDLLFEIEEQEPNFTFCIKKNWTDEQVAIAILEKYKKLFGESDCPEPIDHSGCSDI